jgi:DNA-binding NarL/FixJ family response regulator
MKVAVIDDDQVQLNMMQRWLSHEPWCEEVLAIKNEVGCTNAVRAFDPDVVLMDLSMPHISGAELLEIMMRPDQLPDACFIVFSGRDATELRRVQLSCGADLALSKNIELVHIASHIRSFEGRRDVKRKMRLSLQKIGDT